MSTHLIKLGGEENSKGLCGWSTEQKLIRLEIILTLKKELWTQQEVADYFRVVPSTVKNWRDRGLINYWQAPGSSRVLYYADEIKDFRNKNTFNGKGEKPQQKDPVLKKVPFISPTSDDDWRI